MNVKHWKWLGLFALMLFAFGVSQAPAVQAEGPHIDHVWTGGPGTHADGFYSTAHGDHLDLEFHDDTGGSLPPGEVLILAGEGRISSSPTYQSLLGVTEPVWVLPHSPTSESPGFDWVDESGNTLGAGWSNATIRLESVTLPSATARVAIWDLPVFTPEIRFDSNLATPQSWNTGAPAHGHIGWGFTETGLYILEVSTEITHSTAGVLSSSTQTYYACVIDDDEADIETVCGVELHDGGDPGDPGDPGEPSDTGDVELEADVEAGGLSISIAADHAHLESAGLSNGLRRFEGTLPEVTVVDLRDGGLDWSVNGTASDFVNQGPPGNSFGGNRLGWTPAVVQDDLVDPAHVDAGGAAAPGPNPTDGLGAPGKTLAESHLGGFGSAVISAALELAIPVTTPLGSYVSTLTLTVI